MTLNFDWPAIAQSCDTLRHTTAVVFSRAHNPLPADLLANGAAIGAQYLLGASPSASASRGNELFPLFEAVLIGIGALSGGSASLAQVLSVMDEPGYPGHLLKQLQESAPGTLATEHVLRTLAGFATGASPEALIWDLVRLAELEAAPVLRNLRTLSRMPSGPFDWAPLLNNLKRNVIIIEALPEVPELTCQTLLAMLLPVLSQTNCAGRAFKMSSVLSAVDKRWKAEASRALEACGASVG